MNWDKIGQKLSILASAAKYDVSCSSSGGNRSNHDGLGNSHKCGICHSYTEDGRCISLLKILMTNHCIYDCLYCVNRKSNETERATFTVDEVVELSIQFYRRNYIEGLFLSSGILKNPDYTMERLILIAKKLRLEQRFFGYIHLKAIAGASLDLINEAGLWADRLSVNIELPTKAGLMSLAPQKKHHEIIKPMKYISGHIQQYKNEKKVVKSTPKFTPAGQSSQMIIGATKESDLDILRTSHLLYNHFQLKRVYYSAYIPVLSDNKLPAVSTPIPLVRENRLYQSDWLMRFYHYKQEEIVNDSFPNLDLDIDPKLAWALRNRHLFPVDINTADYQMILRIPGIGVRSAKKIVAGRKYSPISLESLKKMGIALSRAKYFMVCKQHNMPSDLDSNQIKQLILRQSKNPKVKINPAQLSLFS